MGLLGKPTILGNPQMGPLFFTFFGVSNVWGEGTWVAGDFKPMVQGGGPHIRCKETQETSWASKRKPELF